MKKILSTAFSLCLLSLTALPAYAERTTTRIAFVDTGNTGRSVTAEAIANAIIKKNKLPIAVISRAVDMNPYETLPEANVEKLLGTQGLDVSSHRATQLVEHDIRHSDLLLTMTQKHKDMIVSQFPIAKGKTFTITEYATGASKDVEDAWGKNLPAYKEMIAELKHDVPLTLNKVAKR